MVKQASEQNGTDSSLVTDSNSHQPTHTPPDASSSSTMKNQPIVIEDVDATDVSSTHTGSGRVLDGSSETQTQTQTQTADSTNSNAPPQTQLIDERKEVEVAPSIEQESGPTIRIHLPPTTPTEQSLSSDDSAGATSSTPLKQAHEEEQEQEPGQQIELVQYQSPQLGSIQPKVDVLELPRTTVGGEEHKSMESPAAIEKKNNLSVTPQPQLSPSPGSKAVGIFKKFPARSPPPVLQQYEHILSIANLEHGLSAEVVEKQRAQYGWNESIEEQTPLWLVFAKKFWGATPFMIMLTMAISFGLKQWVDGAVITLLLFINGIIAFHEDVRARKAVAELIKKLQVMVRAHRDDKWSEMPSRELVPGDCVRIRTGDIVGADVVLTDGQLSVDQSSLTGESALKSMTRDSIVYAGSIIKRGEANCIVIAIGNSTYFGKTARLVQASKPSAHIDRIVQRVVVVLMTIVVALIIATIIVLAVRGDNVLDVIPLLLMVIISALPVALPAMFTVSLALGSKELSERSVLVTRLHVLEDAAMMSILFSDKTGTLTQNKLSIQEIQHVKCVQKNKLSSNDILLAAALCSRKENSDPIDLAILDAYDKQVKAIGEGSGKSEANDLLLFPEMKTKHYPSVHFIPFDFSLRRTEAMVRYSLSSSSSSDVSTGPILQYGRMVKGAVTTLAYLSGLDDTSQEWKELQDMVTENAKHGYRTIAVGRQLLSEQEMQTLMTHVKSQPDDPASVTSHATSATVTGASNTFEHPFELLGLIVLFDPPRDDSGHIIQQLKDLGIQTKMLTGDAVGVAAEIGGRLGLGREFINLEHEKEELKAKILEEDSKHRAEEVQIDMSEGDEKAKAIAKELNANKLEDRIIAELLERHDPLSVSGFAQIYPSDKHFIVKHTQAKGFICGMTGDGVNDAPALKQAEVGCAMDNATDVAKGSASVVLLSPGLGGVVDVVEVGRQVHRRVEVWVIMKAAKACMHSIFILVMFMITGKFPITALAVVLLLLLMDFVLVSISTDRQEPGSKPKTWNLAQLTRIGLVIGLLGAGQMMCLLFVLKRHLWHGSDEANMTLAWLAMYLWGMLAIFSVRERNAFWHSRPSHILLWVVVFETIAVWIVCALGIDAAGIVSIGWGYASATVGIALGCFVLNDQIKVLYIKQFEKDY